MSGRHDRGADPDVSPLLATGPILIRGLSRGFRQGLAPGRPSRHRGSTGPVDRGEEVLPLDDPEGGSWRSPDEVVSDPSTDLPQYFESVEDLPADEPVVAESAEHAMAAPPAPAPPEGARSEAEEEVLGRDPSETEDLYAATAEGSSKQPTADEDPPVDDPPARIVIQSAQIAVGRPVGEASDPEGEPQALSGGNVVVVAADGVAEVDAVLADDGVVIFGDIRGEEAAELAEVETAAVDDDSLDGTAAGASTEPAVEPVAPAADGPASVASGPSGTAGLVADSPDVAQTPTIPADDANRDDAGPDGEGVPTEDEASVEALAASPVAGDEEPPAGHDASAPANSAGAGRSTPSPALVAPPSSASSRPLAPSRSPSGRGRGPAGRRTALRERFGREAVGIAVLVVLALVCAGLITAVVVKTRNDAAAAAREAAAYTPPPLTAPTTASSGPIVVVLGDEAALSHPSSISASAQWPALLAKGAGGSSTTLSAAGYAASAQDESFASSAALVPQSAQVVVVAGASVDPTASPVSLANAATTTYSAIKQQAPEAKLIIVGPFLRAAGTTAELANLRDALRSSAMIAKARWVDPISGDWIASSTATTLSAADQKTIASKLRSSVATALKGSSSSSSARSSS